MSKTRDIAFCVNDPYVKYICITIKSLVLSNPNMLCNVHVVTDSISESSRHLLSKTIEKHKKNVTLHIYEIDDTPIVHLSKRIYTKYAWYRILIPKLLTDVDIILYLDADTLINGDISPIFEIDMTGKSIAGVLDNAVFNSNCEEYCGYPFSKGYVSSGVLLMNLDYWRKNNITDKVIKWAEDNKDKILYPDQDSINYICQDDKVLIPFKYNITQNLLLSSEFYKIEYKDELLESIKDPRIIHYTYIPPWFLECDHPFKTYWDRINRLLPLPISKSFKFPDKSKLIQIKRRIYLKLNPHCYGYKPISDIQKEIENIGSKKNLNIAFCVSDNYVQYICVTIMSIIVNNPKHEFNIHVLIDKISQDSLKRLTSTIGKDKERIKLSIHEVDDSNLLDLKQGHWTKYAWYRLLLPNLLPDVDKILYLDADTLVMSDISHMFNFDLEGKSLAAGIDYDGFQDNTYERIGYPKEKGYVCSGVLLLNLDYWRKEKIAEKVIDFARHYPDRLKFPDQDAINYVCQDTKLLLPLKYAVTDWAMIGPFFYQKRFKDQMLECVNSPVIIHFGAQSPWFKDCRTPQCEYWLEYNAMIKYKVYRRYNTTTKWDNFKCCLYDLLNPFKKRYASMQSLIDRVNAI